MSQEIEYFECKEDWDECDECYGCGQKVFKYYNMSKRIYFAKCGVVDKVCEMSIKNKKMTWVKNKKQPCGWNAIFEVQGVANWVNNKKPSVSPPRPFKEIKEETNKHLENWLRSKFAYLKISRNQVALQEINNVVERKLLREPRKIYYYPTAGQFMRISHYEKIVDFEERIFSQPIDDKTLVERKRESKKYCKKPTIIEEDTVDNLIDDINQMNLNDDEDLSDDDDEEDDNEDKESENGDSNSDDGTSVSGLEQDEDDDVFDENYEEDEFLEEPEVYDDD